MSIGLTADWVSWQSARRSYITSTARCKSQQNVLTTEIKIKTSNKKVLENKSVLKTVNSHNGTLHV